MATYRQLSLYLIELERGESFLLGAQKIGTGIFALVLIAFIVVLYCNSMGTNDALVPFFSDVEGVFSMCGITTSSLATYLYTQAKLSDLNERKVDIFIRIARMQASGKTIPYSSYEEILMDSFKDSLKSK